MISANLFRTVIPAKESMTQNLLRLTLLITQFLLSHKCGTRYFVSAQMYMSSIILAPIITQHLFHFI